VSITVTSILEKVRTELRDVDENHPKWSDGELLEYVNEAWSIIHTRISERHAPTLQLTENITFQAGETTKQMSATPLEVKSVKSSDGVLITYVHPDLMPPGQEAGGNTPSYWTLTGVKSITVWPSLDSAFTLSIRYMPDCSNLAKSGSIDLPDKFGWFFKEYALLRAYNRTEAKPEIEMLFWGRYGADLNRMLERRVPELITGHGPWVV